MKKFFNILFAVCGLVALSSCDDEVENPYSAGSTISVVSAQMSFSPQASHGSIKFTSVGGTVTVTTPVAWCRPVIDGDSVLVDVDENNSFSSRSTVVVLHNGTDSVQVALIQRGIALSASSDRITSGDAASRKSVLLASNFGVELVSAPDWVNATLASDSLIVDFTENTTGHVRTGYVKFKSGVSTDSVQIVQADFATDIAGNYRLYYNVTVDSTSSIDYFEAELTATTLIIPDFNLSIPVEFDDESKQLVIASGSYVGDYGNKSLFLPFGVESEQLWTQYLTIYTMAASFTYDDVNGTTAPFQGSIMNLQGLEPPAFDCFILRQFSSKEMSEETDEGDMLRLYYPYLRREPAGAAAYVLK